MNEREEHRQELRINNEGQSQSTSRIGKVQESSRSPLTGENNSSLQIDSNSISGACVHRVVDVN
jgi:hypothetical protein